MSSRALDPEIAGAAVADLLRARTTIALAYLLTAAGLEEPAWAGQGLRGGGSGRFRKSAPTPVRGP